MLDTEELYQKYRDARDKGEALDEHLAALYRVLLRQVRAVVFRIIGRQLEDFAEQVANLILQRIDTFRGESKFSTWVYAFVAHQCYNEIEKRNKEVQTDIDFADRPSAIDAKLSIESLLRKLKPKYKEVVELSLQGYSAEDIAVRLGLSRAAVLQRYSRAVAKMKKIARRVPNAARKWV